MKSYSFYDGREKVGKLKTTCDHLLDIDYANVLRTYWGLDDWVALFILILGIAFFWLDIPESFSQKIFRFFQSIHAELIGIGVTVLILGNADQKLRMEAEKSRLILQMGNSHNGFARDAVRQLRQKGWLFDGSLHGANLSHANLAHANLEEAHLEGVNLSGANLKGATLKAAHLERADLHLAHLERTDLEKVHLNEASLKKTHLTGAHAWSVHLEGASFEEAHLESCDFHNAYYDNQTNWKEAIYTKGSNGTKWPDDFDPETKGCNLVEDNNNEKLEHRTAWHIKDVSLAIRLGFSLISILVLIREFLLNGKKLIRTEEIKKHS
jgi:hypothetical protein